MNRTATNAEFAQLDGCQMLTEPTAIDQSHNAGALKDSTHRVGSVYHAH